MTYWGCYEENLELRLIGLSLLCAYCHDFQHWDHTIMSKMKKTYSHEFRTKLDIHFMKVNQCKQDILKASLFMVSRQVVGWI